MDCRQSSAGSAEGKKSRSQAVHRKAGSARGSSPSCVVRATTLGTRLCLLEMGGGLVRNHLGINGTSPHPAHGMTVLLNIRESGFQRRLLPKSRSRHHLHQFTEQLLRSRRQRNIFISSVLAQDNFLVKDSNLPKRTDSLNRVLQIIHPDLTQHDSGRSRFLHPVPRSSRHWR